MGFVIEIKKSGDDGLMKQLGKWSMVIGLGILLTSVNTLVRWHQPHPVSFRWGTVNGHAGITASATDQGDIASTFATNGTNDTDATTAPPPTLLADGSPRGHV